jgi:diguanylate cyclase (GGDEF)-like protein
MTKPSRPRPRKSALPRQRGLVPNAASRNSPGKPVRAQKHDQKASGDVMILPPDAGGDRARLDAALRKVRRLEKQLAAARERIAGLEERADTDFLLGVLNRRGFARELRRSLAYSKRHAVPAAIIYLDVDGLKPINDRFGHAAGDALLQAIAAELQRRVRQSDVVARLGGDEFGLLLWNLSEDDAIHKALALEQAIDGLGFEFGDCSIAAGISAGVAAFESSDEVERVLARADRAMYVRKAIRRQKPQS